MVSIRTVAVLFITCLPLCMAYNIIKEEMDEAMAKRWRLQRIRTCSSFVIALAGWSFFSQLKDEFVVEAQQLAAIEGRRLEIAPVMGDSRCPCKTLEELNPFPVFDVAHTREELRLQPNLTTYGVGCGKHDAGITKSCLKDCKDCGTDWCDRAWCWVSDANCNLLNHRSAWISEPRYYSYATCYELDYLTGSTRLQFLHNRTLKVGFVSNSGGWTGAFHVQQKNFIGPLSDWSGPLVKFIEEAARIGKFNVELTPPAALLRSRSNQYFNSTDSPFNDCVYSVALGVLDMCVSEFTVTDLHASMTPWFVIDEPDLVLVTQTVSVKTTYARAVLTIFKPFTFQTWTFLIFGMIPLLGILVICHEYDETGSAFPKTDEFLEYDHDGQNLLVRRRIPLYRHLVRAVYTSYLGVLQATYSLPVVTPGGKLHVLGVAFFTLVLLAVYTAKLASLLVEKNLVEQITSLEEATKSGYRFCADRTTLAVLNSLHNIDEKAFVVDPLDLGGDGFPGFLSKRTLVFDRLDPTLALLDKRFCHAAITFYQDLQVEQRDGRHCNKTAISSNTLGHAQTGMPLFDSTSRELQTLLTFVKNSGEMTTQLNLAEPEPNCPVVVAESGATASLTVRQLSGIWFVSFGYAILGLIATFGKPCYRKYYRKRFHHFSGFDQTGNRIDKLEDSKLREELENHPAHPVAKRKKLMEEHVAKQQASRRLSSDSNHSTRSLFGKLALFLDRGNKNPQDDDDATLDHHSFMGKEWPEELVGTSKLRSRTVTNGYPKVRFQHTAGTSA